VAPDAREQNRDRLIRPVEFASHNKEAQGLANREVARAALTSEPGLRGNLAVKV
jgi:hypothetical protein